MRGIIWLSEFEALDLLRVGDENTDIIQTLAASIPAYVEVVTGYPAELTAGATPSEVVKPLCRFILQLWYNPDGTDAQQLTRVIDSMAKTVKALVVAGDLDTGE